MPPVTYLAVSGGGDNGAFGAGLMNGWTETGTRPEFKMVTGVSTGALIAPFAFLGSRLRRHPARGLHDHDAREGLPRAWPQLPPCTMTPWPTPRRSRRCDRQAMPTRRCSTPSRANTRQGRLLMIGTTDLDAQRPVIWNIGALAASGHPGALDLFRKILRASAAIPGAFQPVLIDVEIDGRKYQEMHVDGGAIAQLFLYPPSIDLSKSGVRRVRHAYIIRNARLDPDYARANGAPSRSPAAP